MDIGKPKQDSKFKCDKEKIDTLEPIKIIKSNFLYEQKENFINKNKINDKLGEKLICCIAKSKTHSFLFYLLFSFSFPLFPLLSPFCAFFTPIDTLYLLF